MGLEEVRIVQTLIFQGGKAPSMFVPRIVPKIKTGSQDIAAGVMFSYAQQGHSNLIQTYRFVKNSHICL